MWTWLFLFKFYPKQILRRIFFLFFFLVFWRRIRMEQMSPSFWSWNSIFVCLNSSHFLFEVYTVAAILSDTHHELGDFPLVIVQVFSVRVFLHFSQHVFNPFPESPKKGLYSQNVNPSCQKEREKYNPTFLFSST